MHSDYFIGIDIGTTAVKVIAFSAAGKVLLEQSGTYPIVHPQPDRSEQDPDEILRALFGCVENTVRYFRDQPPVLVCFSSAMHGLLAVDAQGAAISKCLIWADNRAAAIAGRLHAENRAAVFYFKTGVPVHAMSPLCKLLWWKDNDPLLFRQAYKFVGIKEYLFFKLFGRWVVDSSVAAATGLMNMVSRQWDADILETLGIRADQLSQIVSVREIFRAPKGFPAMEGSPFVIGGSDGALANLGTSRDEHALVVSIGTSCAARMIVPGPLPDPAMKTFCYHVQDGFYLVGGAGNNGAIVLQWLKDNFFLSGEALPDFLSAAASVPAGSGDLIFLPYILGERAPIWNEAARGVLFGLSVNHNRAQVIRAAMEGVIFCVYAMGRLMLEKKDIREIFATGGFARDETWLQMLADVFGLPVNISETTENAAWGAVVLGLEALSYRREEAGTPPRRLLPSGPAHAIYQRQFARFERLYRLLEDAF